jgi:lipopolysaccharide export system ATP-binding protein
VAEIFLDFRQTTKVVRASPARLFLPLGLFLPCDLGTHGLLYTVSTAHWRRGLQGGEWLTMALLEVQGLVKKFGRRTVVDGVNFEVNPGEVVGLLGPNGAGKTTSFRMATGQITPNDGTVLFDNQEVTHLPMFRRARLGMGYLSQEQSIFRKLTVEKNLLAILESLPQSRSLGRSLTSRERRERAEEALQRFNLLHVRNNPAARCSGGEKRRLEIARCLVCEPMLILLDEPFAAVDPKTTEDIRKNIRDLADQGIGILLTDHNVREVVKTADRIYLIVEGKVVCHGTPDKLIRDRVAIDAYLGTTFQDDVLMARLAGFAGFNEPAPEPIALTPAAAPVFKAQPVVVPPVAPRPVAPKAPPPPIQIDDTIPVQRVVPRPATTPNVSPPPPAARFSSATQRLVEEEKLRRLIDQLQDRDAMPTAWHEIASQGDVAVPVLLEALERPEVEIRHLSFRLLESITGQTLDFQSDAASDLRLKQVAHLRAKLEK